MKEGARGGHPAFTFIGKNPKIPIGAARLATERLVFSHRLRPLLSERALERDA